MNSSLPLAGQVSSLRLTLLGTGAAVLFGGLAYLAALGWPLLFPRPVMLAQAPAHCDLGQGACTATFTAKEFIRLAIQPGMPAATGALRILVDTHGIGAQALTVDFGGVDMDMGLVRAEMLDTGGGSFAGDVSLPACVRQRMTWKAVARAWGPAGLHEASFRFEMRR